MEKINFCDCKINDIQTFMPNLLGDCSLMLKDTKELERENYFITNQHQNWLAQTAEYDQNKKNTPTDTFKFTLDNVNTKDDREDLYSSSKPVSTTLSELLFTFPKEATC